MQRFEIPDPQALPEQLPPGRTEPMNTQELSPQIDFLYRAADNFTQSVQFADAKAGGVVLILSIGILDLFKQHPPVPRRARHLGRSGAGSRRFPA